MYCPQCHAAVPDNAKFCSQCGQDLAAPFVADDRVPSVTADDTEDEYIDSKKELLQMLEIPLATANEVAMFYLTHADYQEMVRDLRLPTYQYENVFICVNGIYRYWISSGAFVHVMVTDESMRSLELRSYIAARDEFLRVLPRKYHVDADTM